MKRSVFIILLLMTGTLSAQITDYSMFVPMPVPRWKPPAKNNGAEHHLLEYNCTTHTSIIKDTNLYLEEFSQTTTEGFIPDDILIAEEIIGQKNFNDLTQVSDPTPFPWCTNVKLFMTFPNNSHYVGSGVLINSRYVLTAGHCIYSHDNGGWASTIEVVPAYYSGNKPFGSAYSANLFSWTGWTVSEDWEWDMGYIKLGTPIGEQTGYLGFGYNNNDNFFQTSTFHNPGYPAESPHNGQLMYYWYGTYDQVMTDLLYLNKYCYGGQSGSGSYYKDGSNNRIVYAVLSHYSSVNGTGHVRINQTKYNSINNEINSSSSIQDISNGNRELWLWPNPANDHLNVRLADINGPLHITISDCTGRIILKSEIEPDGTKINIPLRGLSPGGYAICVSCGNSYYSSRFIKL